METLLQDNCQGSLEVLAGVCKERVKHNGTGWDVTQNVQEGKKIREGNSQKRSWKKR